MQKLILILLGLSSCGQSDKHAFTDFERDMSSKEDTNASSDDVADSQSPNPFDGLAAHKKHCLKYDTQETCDDDQLCTTILGARCGTSLITCVPLPLACGQLVTPGRSPDGVCYVYGSTCMPDGFVQEEISYEDCMNEGCE